MSHTATVETRQLALELHDLLSDLDPARWREGAESAIRERAASLESKIAALLDSSRPRLASARIRLAELLALLRNSLAEAAGRASAEHWEALREKAIPIYEALAAALRDLEIHVPSLRPTNYKRNIFHVLSGATAIAAVVILADFTLLAIVAGSLAVTTWILETTRRIWPRWNDILLNRLGPLAHPHEYHRVNSATWYINALFILALIGSKPMVLCALAVLAAGDPAAALIGRRIGKISLIHGRTLEGTLAFVGFGTITALLVGLWLLPSLTFGSIALLALGGAVAGSLAELFSRRIDDNLSVPIAAAGGVALTAWLAGIPIG